LCYHRLWIGSSADPAWIRFGTTPTLVTGMQTSSPCRLSRIPVWTITAVLVWASSATAQPANLLTRARLLYNQRQFEGAIAAADEVQAASERAGADLIAARAYLERFRESASPADLTRARERLRRIEPVRLTAAERLELVVGLAEALYFDGSPGAAADVFESVLSRRDQVEGEAHERVLDWWATAIDAEARPKPDIERQALYMRMRERMRAALAMNPGSAAASYWLSAAARGQGDLLAAWEAAEAGWVRAPLAKDRGMSLRSDLDRLVRGAIAPERARAMAQPAEALLTEWENFKEKWGAP
jgi:hypothetical protein